MALNNDYRLFYDCSNFEYSRCLTFDTYFVDYWHATSILSLYFSYEYVNSHILKELFMDNSRDGRLAYLYISMGATNTATSLKCYERFLHFIIVIVGNDSNDSPHSRIDYTSDDFIQWKKNGMNRGIHTHVYENQKKKHPNLILSQIPTILFASFR